MSRVPLSKREQRRKLRERAKFWDRHGEKLRIGAIGGGIVVAMLVFMKGMMGG